MARFLRSGIVITWALAFLTLAPSILAQGQGDFEPAQCPFAVPADQTVECGYLLVPEDRSDASSRDIALAVAIVRASGEPVQPDPIVYLEGGPGGSALLAVDAWYNTVYGQDRDIVLIDQRGTGFSEPGLFCLDEADDEIEAARTCRDGLESQGIDLAAYNSAENAADIEDLRLALGYERINLYGVSYGTRLALTVMRDYPDGIRSVILDSPFPPAADAFNEDGVNFVYALRTLADDCAADAACDSAYPDLETAFVTLVEAAYDRPILLDMGDGEEELYGGDIIEMFYGYFYDTQIIPYLPALIYDLADGRDDALIAFEESLPDAPDDGAPMTGTADEIDFDAMSDAEFEAYLMDALGFDDVDELFDFLDSLSDDEYETLLDELASEEGNAPASGGAGMVDFDAMSDAEFEAYLMDALGFDDVDELFDYLDSLSDDEYGALLDELSGYDDVAADGDLDAEVREDAQGMFNSVTCAEEVPFSSLDQQEALLADAPDVIYQHFREGLENSLAVCDIWDVPGSGPIEDEIVSSDIPTLILVGEYDVATPPAWADLAAQGLSDVTILTFAGGGHGLIDAFDCSREVGSAFIADPAAPLDRGCVDEIEPPEFYVP